MVIDGEDAWEDVAEVLVQRSRINGEFRARLIMIDQPETRAAVWSVPVWLVDASGQGWRTVTGLLEETTRRVVAALRERGSRE